MNIKKDDTRGWQAGGGAPTVLSAGTLMGDKVCNARNEQLGDIKELMIDIATGRVAYAVLAFGGILGMGEKLFAVPWSALTLDTKTKSFILNVEKDRLEKAPGFDKDHWPNMSDPTWARDIHTHYGTSLYAEPARA